MIAEHEARGEAGLALTPNTDRADRTHRFEIAQCVSWPSSPEEEAPVKAALVFVLATIGFYVAIEISWFVYADYATPADREGALGMDVVFVIGPICAIFD